MSFLNPTAFWLFWLVPVIVLFYLLKLRREDQVVSSTYLWQKLVRDMQANTPWQRLRPNLLLFLQLLFLIALILAITRPFVWKQGIDSRAVILIFDTSASMSATDIKPSRIEAAKTAAQDLVDGLSGEARITIITAGARPLTLVSLSKDRKLVQQAIAQVEASITGANLASALQIASAVAERQADSQIVVYSDGNFDMPGSKAIPSNLTWVLIGERGDNQAIDRLTLQTNPLDRTITAFAQIANHSPKVATRRIALVGDGATISVSDIEIPAHGEQPVIVTGIMSSTQIVEAQLLPTTTTADFLPADDRAVAVQRTAAPRRVALVSTGNRFLETALSLIPGIELDLKQPTDALDPATSLVVYDGVSPQPDLPTGVSLLFIGPLESTGFFTVTGKIDLPAPAISNPDEVLMNNVELSGISILDSARILTPTWAKTLIEDTLSPDPRPALLFAGETDNRRVAVLSFNLNHSDLPLQIAFPVLISNLVHWLSPEAGGLIPASVSPGTAISLKGVLQPGENPEEPIRVTYPDGTILQIDPGSANPIFSNTQQQGVYSIKLPNGRAFPFAVNLFSPEESNIEPHPIMLSVETSPGSGQPPAQRSKQEWWRPLAVLALAFLILEWLLYHRAALSQLFSRQSGIKPKSRKTAI